MSSHTNGRKLQAHFSQADDDVSEFFIGLLRLDPCPYMKVIGKWYRLDSTISDDVLYVMSSGKTCSSFRYRVDLAAAAMVSFVENNMMTINSRGL